MDTGLAKQKISIKMRIASFLKKTFVAAKDNQKIKYLGSFVVIVMIYGIMIAFVFNRFLNFSFSIDKIIAFGIISYIIKVELPDIVAKCLPRMPPIL